MTQEKSKRQLPAIELELGKGRLDEIETAVEEMRKNLLPEISSELLQLSQKTFTEEKKKS
jgi:hypothetical protein